MEHIIGETERRIGNKEMMIAVKSGEHLEERRWRNREVTAGESKVGGREEKTVNQDEKQDNGRRGGHGNEIEGKK